MKKIILSLFLLSVCLPVLANQRVSGYTRSNGTYVQPYTRSSPNGIKFDNYSTKGNYNPYNGNEGTVNVYTQQQNYGYNYGFKNGKNYNGN